MRFVEVMNLGLKFFDAPPFLGAGKLEAAHSGSRATIIIKVVPDGAESAKNEDNPKPFALADGIDKHPALENKKEQGER